MKKLYLTAYDNETDESSGFMSAHSCTHWIKSMIENFPVESVLQDDRFVISYDFMTKKQFENLPESD